MVIHACSSSFCFLRTYITGNGAYFLCLAAIFGMAFAIEVLNFHRYNIQAKLFADLNP